MAKRQPDWKSVLGLQGAFPGAVAEWLMGAVAGAVGVSNGGSVQSDTTWRFCYGSYNAHCDQPCMGQVKVKRRRVELPSGRSALVVTSAAPWLRHPVEPGCANSEFGVCQAFCLPLSLCETPCDADHCVRWEARDAVL